MKWFKKKIKYYFDNNYIRRSDWKKGRFFSLEKNEYLDTGTDCPDIYLEAEVTEEDFNRQHKNNHCNCPVGEGHDTHTCKKYTVDDLDFKFIYAEEITGRHFFTGKLQSMYNVYHNDACGRKITTVVPVSFYKKACLQCDTCLDEYQQFRRYILNAVYEAQDRENAKKDRNNRVNEICGG